MSELAEAKEDPGDFLFLRAASFFIAAVAFILPTLLVAYVYYLPNFYSTNPQAMERAIDVAWNYLLPRVIILSFLASGMWAVILFVAFFYSGRRALWLLIGVPFALAPLVFVFDLVW